MKLEDILDENEMMAVQAFNASDTMKQAVKKVLLAGIYENGTMKAGKEVSPTQNAAFWMVSNVPDATSQEVGEELKALWQGINALEHGFDKISEATPTPKAEPKPNQAR